MKKQHFYIKQITAPETYTVRHSVLRIGKPIDSCVFNGDHLETTIHLGVFDAMNLIGVCSLVKNNSTEFSVLNQYQLRGMAVLKSHQSIGVGKELLKHCEVLLIEKKIELIWCNAREVAINFYKKNGYTKIGTSFHIKDVGTHFVMTKQLNMVT